MSAPYALHWFRRDLRIAGNAALQAAYQKFPRRILGVFFIDPSFLSRPDFSTVRFAFFLKTLHALQKELRQQGGDLWVMDGGPQDGWTRLLTQLKTSPHGLPKLVTWNRDYEPFARARDENVSKLLNDWDIPQDSERDHLILEPHEVYVGDEPEQGYKVYTPFSRRWLEQLAHHPERLSPKRTGITYLEAMSRNEAIDPGLFELTWPDLHPQASDHFFESLLEKTLKACSVTLPDAGSQAAYRQLMAFSSRLERYTQDRDYPGVHGTSRLSIYLKNGSLSSAQVVAALKLTPYAKGSQDGAARFYSELIWREFYYHILYRHPRVEHESFQERYRFIPWPNRQDWLKAWTSGQTGFPIVDAGLRELAQTGWMHNRVRMIVASFLTKDLLIDWRLGERHFMHSLLDGDLAPNNGGWQWAASTGCDAQPSFRIFNPWRQSAQFDPEGTYIKTYVPELKAVSPQALHDPQALSSCAPRGYPAPIVDHAVQRPLALSLYRQA